MLKMRSVLVLVMIVSAQSSVCSDRNLCDVPSTDFCCSVNVDGVSTRTCNVFNNQVCAECACLDVTPTTAAGAPPSPTPALAQLTPLTMKSYKDSMCQIGELEYKFFDSCTMLPSALFSPGTSIYAKGGCRGSQVFMWLCNDSGCSDCKKPAAATLNNCGSGLGNIYPYLTLTCGSSGSGGSGGSSGSSGDEPSTATSTAASLVAVALPIVFALGNN